MNKNIEKLLLLLGVEEDLKSKLLSEEEDDDAINEALILTQKYAKPFVEIELNEKFKTERSTLKGKYLKEALHKANKAFGNALTNKEIEEVLNDPENEGKTYDKAIDLLKQKISDKTGASETELQKMLDLANQKLADYEQKIPEIESKAEQRIKEEIEKFKLDGVLTEKLINILEGKTIIPAIKAAELIRGKLSQRALLRLKDDNNIALYNLAKNDELLKKNETTLQTLESVVDEIVKEYDLEKKSNGTETTKVNLSNNKDNEGMKKNAASSFMSLIDAKT